MRFFTRFTRSAHSVRLPALPRRLSVMAISALMASGLMLSPFLVTEMVRTRMNEAVQQAITLAQISHVHAFEGRRPNVATQELPLVGFEIATPEAATPMQSWLVMEPSPRADSHGTHFKITIPHDAKNAPRDQVLEASPSLDAPAAEG